VRAAEGGCARCLQHLAGEEAVSGCSGYTLMLASYVVTFLGSCKVSPGAAIMCDLERG
jgi:hypothetical protein